MKTDERFHSLDVVRAGALLLGVALHSTMSFWPGMREVRWPISDDATSVVASGSFFVIHIFRMSAFYVIAGFFARLLVKRLGTWGFVKNRLRRIALPFLAAMVVVMPFLFLPFIWGQRQLGIVGPPLIKPPIPDPQLPPWGHLWFLYLLLVLYALWTGARLLMHALDRRGTAAALADRGLHALIAGRLPPLMLAAPLVLAAPTALVLYSTPWWSMWQGIPPPIMGFIPNVPALVAFGTAFGFGWFVHRRPLLLESLAQGWWLNLVWAVALSAVALALIGARPQLGVVALPGHERAVFAAAYNVATWCWVLGLLGAATRFLSAPSRGWRYLADASFFVYLAHLPIVYALQAWMLRWPVPWAVKYLLIVAIAVGVTLAMYHYLVRSTFVGVFLNGRRYPRERSATAARTSPG
ncbi:MAG TPA: acyltransferase family protein [Steroidobacteraceae bacterium]|nr:acyltransferase family protein [Steroidobacteraceae bacterium]